MLFGAVHAKKTSEIANAVRTSDGSTCNFKPKTLMDEQGVPGRVEYGGGTSFQSLMRNAGVRADRGAAATFRSALFLTLASSLPRKG